MTRRKTLLIAMAASVALLALWLMVLWFPQGKRIADAEKRRDEAQDTNAQLTLRLSRLEAAQERAPELTADLEELRVAIPDSPDLAQFILDADDAASTSGVEFIQITPSKPAANADLTLPSVVGLSITVEGGYFQVLNFLNLLSELPRIVVVDDLALTPGEGDSVLAVAITARMFTTKAPAGGVVDPATGETTTTTVPAGGSTTTTTAPGSATTIASGAIDG